MFVCVRAGFFLSIDAIAIAAGRAAGKIRFFASFLGVYLSLGETGWCIGAYCKAVFSQRNDTVLVRDGCQDINQQEPGESINPSVCVMVH